MPEEKMRLDVCLVQRGLTDSREKARRLIAEGQVAVNGQVVQKPSKTVAERDTIAVKELPKFVGRGGYKLEAALRHSGITPEGAVALDVGASTGGFTQCMLMYGAQKVVAVDVGSGQLHPSLREDPRVCSLESTDIRKYEAIAPHMPQGGFHFASVDVSFISLQLVMDAITALLCDGAHLVCLIKPQFEAGRSAVGKGGIVKDWKEHKRVLTEWSRRFGTYGLNALCLLPSPIRGGDGNGEYLAVLQKAVEDTPVRLFTATEIDAAIVSLRQQGK